MTNPIERLATQQPVLCAVCRRRAASHLAYAPFGSHGPVLWLCGDPGCCAGATSLRSIDLDDVETMALMEAGEAAGEWLDSIGTTDLTKLSQAQWLEFLARVIGGFEHAMRRIVADHVAPF